MRKVGEAAIVDTEGFSLEGKSRQNLRTAINRCEREGATFGVLAPGEAPASPLHGFEGLRVWKSKFIPVWRPRFIAAPASTPLAFALLDVALLTSGGGRGVLGLKR